MSHWKRNLVSHFQWHHLQSIYMYHFIITNYVSHRNTEENLSDFEASTVATVGDEVASDCEAQGSLLTSGTWSNSLIVGIYPAASAWRRVFISIGYMPESKANLLWLHNPLVCFLMKTRNVECTFCQCKTRVIWSVFCEYSEKKVPTKWFNLIKLSQRIITEISPLASDEDMHVKSNLFI